jgi:hypothetical protein
VVGRWRNANSLLDGHVLPAAVTRNRRRSVRQLAVGAFATQVASTRPPCSLELRVAITVPPLRISTVAGPSGQFPVKVACNLTLSPQYFCVSSQRTSPHWQGGSGQGCFALPAGHSPSFAAGGVVFLSSLTAASLSSFIGDDVLQPGERFLLERRGPGFGPDNSLIFQRSGNLSDTEDPRRE